MTLACGSGSGLVHGIRIVEQPISKGAAITRARSLRICHFLSYLILLFEIFGAGLGNSPARNVFIVLTIKAPRSHSTQQDFQHRFNDSAGERLH